MVSTDIARGKEKLLIVTSTFPRHIGDAVSARFVFDLARALTAHYQVHVLTPHSPGSRRSEVLDGIKVHRFLYFVPAGLEKLTTGEGILANCRKNGFLFLQLPFLFLSEIFQIVRLVKKENISIINSHWIVPQGIAVALVKGYLGVKHVMTVHAAGIFTLKRWGSLGRKLAGFIVRRSDAVMPVSSYIKATLDGLVDGRYVCNILPMGANTGLFNGGEEACSGKKERGFRVLFVGKIVEKKGLKYFLEAVSILKKKSIPVELIVAGGGPLEKELMDYALELGTDKDVSFLGWVPNEKLPELYRSVDMTVVPSVFDRKGETEGMPVVVLESMAMARPVLASRISGIPDIVKDGVNGWLVEPGSSKAFADRIEKISDADLNRCREGALNTASKFSYGSIASGYRKVIDAL